MKDELLSVQAAAAELGVSPRRIQKLIQDGRLVAEVLKGSNVLIIRKKDLEPVRVRTTGRPKKGSR